MDAVSLRRLILGVSVGVALLFMVGVWQSAPQQSPVLEPELAAMPPEQPQTPVVDDLPPWQLGVWQGRVAVFEQGREEPSRVLDTPVVSLPDPDQAALQQGLPVYSQEELAGLLEDYGS